jgi:phage recombination protein Bet
VTAPEEARAQREREAQRLQRYSLCADCRAGLIVNTIDGEWRAICSKAGLAHAGYIKMGTVAGREERRQLTKDALLREGSMTETQIVRYEAKGEMVALSVPEVRSLINTKATEVEAATFIKICQSFQVNPFLGEAYIIKYQQGEPAAFVIGSAAFLRFASSHPQFDGLQAGIMYRVDDGPVQRREGAIIYPGEELLGGWAEVHRKDRRFSAKEEVGLDRWQRKTRAGEVTRFWKEMPEHMIRKVALHHALKQAFPGLFTGYATQDSDDDQDGIVISPGNYDVLPPEMHDVPASQPTVGEASAEASAASQDVSAPEGTPPQITRTAFFASVRGELDIATTKVAGMLGVKDMDEWEASGRSYGQAYEELRKLRG